MEKAIIVKWECPECGNLTETRQVLMTNQKRSKYAFETLKVCACGKKDGFNLVTFQPATAIIKPDEEDN